MGHIINGKQIAAQTQVSITERIEAFTAKTGVKPGLTVVLVGEDQASQVYVRNKEKRAVAAGINSAVIRLEATTSEAELLAVVEQLNQDEEVHGILVQLPLPKTIDAEKVLDRISPLKDVDGFHPINVGNLAIGKEAFVPCTPAGIIRLIKSTGETIASKEAVVVGRSNIVGKPVAQLLLQENATVTIAHSRTTDLAAVTKRADILVVATGLAKFIKKEHLKPGAIVIDVGMDRDENNKLCGDVDFDDCIDIAGYLTPVPGGVGPMTITMLLENTLISAERHTN